MEKDKVIDVLLEIGVLLELKGENPFKTRAYANGARILEGLTEPLAVLVAEKRLGEIKGIGEALEQKITEQYKVKVAGYIMTDAPGMNAIANWFGISGIQAGTTPPQSDEQKHAVLLNSQVFFQNVCTQLKAGSAMNEYTSMQWSQLVPSHFQTDIPFANLIASWDRVIRAAAPQQCEVLSKE